MSETPIDAFEDLCGDVAEILGWFTGWDPDKAVDAAERALEAHFGVRRRAGRKVVAAEGLRIVGARPALAEEGRLRVQWITEFEPQARWAEPDVGGGLATMPLGYFEDRDLYLVALEWGPSAIVCAWGNRPADHRAASHYALGAETVRAMGPDFAAALERLAMLAGQPYPTNGDHHA